MRVSQRVAHVLRALVRLAQEDGEGFLPAGEVARLLDLPKRQLEREFGQLAKAGVLECRRGASGGCRLARPGDSISVRDVVLVLEGGVLHVPEDQGSAGAEMWDEVQASISGHLDAVTLSHLAQRQDEIDARATQMYYI